MAILAPDVFLTGEARPGKRPGAELEVHAGYPGYTFGYNRTTLANRVHDILTIVAQASQFAAPGRVHLLGRGRVGTAVILARAMAGRAVGRTAVDLNGFDFSQVKSAADERFLPGALKYGGMASFLALCAPGELRLAGNTPADLNLVREAYRSAGAPAALNVGADAGDIDAAVAWLLR